VRVSTGKKGSGSTQYIDVLCKRNGGVSFTLADNQHDAGLERVAFSASSGVPGGYAVSTYNLDYLFSTGSYQDRLSVFRDGRVRIRTASGYTDVGAMNSSWSHFETDRPRFYFNKAVTVNGGAVSSHTKQHLYLQTAGTTQAWIEYNSGWQRNQQGIELCKKNATGCGLKVSDDGGFYDRNDAYLTAQITKGLKVRNAANSGWSALQSGTLSVYGTAYASSHVRADNGFQVDGSTVIDGNTGADLWHRSYKNGGWYSQTHGGGIHMTEKSWVRVYGNKHFLVPGNYVVRADGGFQVDGSTAVDSSNLYHYTQGKGGFRNATYGGGIYMTDSTWVRVYGKKALLVENTIYTSGSVGIGDSSPDYPIDIERDSGGWLAAFENKNGSDTNVYLADNDHGMYIKTRHTDTTSGYVAEFRNHSGSAMTVDNNRRVGIRNENPTYELDVNGTIDGNTVRAGTGYVSGNLGIGDSSPNYPIDIEKSSTNWLVAIENKYGSDTNVYIGDDTQGLHVKTRLTDSTSGYIAEFRNHTGTALYIENNRRVGIKTTSPGYDLEVNGSFQADSIRVGSKTLEHYIRDYINSKCMIFIGMRSNGYGNKLGPYTYTGSTPNGTCENTSGNLRHCVNVNTGSPAGTTSFASYTYSTSSSDLEFRDTWFVALKCY